MFLLLYAKYPDNIRKNGTANLDNAFTITFILSVNVTCISITKIEHISFNIFNVLFFIV